MPRVAVAALIGVIVGCVAIPLIGTVVGSAGTAAAAEGTAGAGVELRSWTVDLPGADATFEQTLVSTRIEVPHLWGPLALRGYLPLATSRDDELDTEISGAGDAQVRLMWPASGTAWTLSLGADFPTGRTGLTTTEALVATRMLGSRVLDFGLKRPGEGFDLMLGASRAIRAGRTTVAGVALAGHLKGDYALYEEDGVEHTASPGNRIHVALSLLAREHPEDPDWDLDLTLGGQWAGDYTLEERGGEITVAEGALGTLDASYRHRVGEEGRLSLSAHLLARDHDELTGGRAIETELLGLSTRWVTALGLGYGRPLGTWADISAGVSYALYCNDPAGDLNSDVTALDLGLHRALGENLQLNASAEYAFGNTMWSELGGDGAADRRPLTGTTLGIGLELVF